MIREVTRKAIRRESMLRKIGVYAVAVVLLATNLYALDRYKKYSRPIAKDYLLKISFTGKKIIMTTYGKDSTETFVYDRNDVSRTASEVSIKGTIVFTKEGFMILGQEYPVDVIDRIDIDAANEDARIYFIKKGEESERKFRSRKNNRVSVLDDIVVTADQFVRGSVAGFWSNIIIDGEVNEDVVSIFGDITVGDRAFVRGDIVAVNGNIEVAKGATVYGEILAAGPEKKRGFDRWRRWQRGEKGFSPILKFYYNRVDGAAPYLGVKFVDEDSLLPTVNIYAGYGFSSERWRYHIGFEQSFLKSHPITIGGAVYRELGSDDDRLISEADNTLFALIATEDYRDYYEAEGGHGFARFTPYRPLSFQAGILAEKYSWLDACRDMWSLFGGSKRFPENFSSVPFNQRTTGIDEIDSGEITSLNFDVTFDTGDNDEPFERSFWKGRASVEWAPDDWNDDFDFARYFARIGRFQTVSRYTGLFLGATYGTSDGHLPMHRKFFLGGLRTLGGYRHKEYTGSEFWLADVEYRIGFPKTDLTGWIFYNGGQIAEKTGALGSAEVKQSLGIGLSFDDNLRIDLAKRLDRSDSSFKIHVILGFNF
jgi:hypothetical protein